MPPQPVLCPGNGALDRTAVDTEMPGNLGWGFLLKIIGIKIGPLLFRQLLLHNPQDPPNLDFRW